jgi:signal transduction histidine kinase
LRMSMRRTLSYLAITALTLAMYAGGFVIFERMFPQAAANRALWIGAGMALLLAFLFNPLLRLAERLTNRLINGARYDPAQMVHEYSASISNIVDLEKLEQVAVSLILNTLDISHGHLLVVSQKDDGEAYSVAPIQSTDGFAPEPLELCPESPIALYFGSEHRPLTQYDIDLLPRFQMVPEADKAWFKASGLDVYVPVIAQGRWIGMFALGSKQSGNPYSNADLLLLSTLSDQTAVALENARLVKDLVQLNHELRSAYDALGRANAHLEKLDKAKTDFINVASHELRTPLTLLSGYGQMLIEEEAIRANPAYQQMIRGIVSGTDRLHEIVDNMLEVAKIDNRALRLDPRPVSLFSLIHQVIAPMEKPVAERRLTLETAGIEDLPSIEADPGALQKVFYHLIVNAIKFTPDGGRIILYGRPVPGAQCPLQKDSVEVVVSDTGIGIDPHNQELVFNKFYQTGEVSLHSTGKTKYKGGGPGLGLAIARGIVEAHAGRIWVESAGYDEKTCPGSHFHILLPATQNGRSLEPTKPAGMIRVQMETWSVTKPN